MARVGLDTSVIVEYIDEEGEYHEHAEAVFSAIISGRLEALIPHPILAETFYVAARLYRELGAGEPEATASKLVKWLYRLPQVKVIGTSLELALEAGKVKLRYKLALTDCYLIAACKIHGCTALFKRPEAEMLKSVEQLKKDYRVVFLEEYK